MGHILNKFHRLAGSLRKGSEFFLVIYSEIHTVFFRMINEKKKPELNPRDTTEPGEIHDTFVKERNSLSGGVQGNLQKKL